MHFIRNTLHFSVLWWIFIKLLSKNTPSNVSLPTVVLMRNRWSSQRKCREHLSNLASHRDNATHQRISISQPCYEERCMEWKAAFYSVPNKDSFLGAPRVCLCTFGGQRFSHAKFWYYKSSTFCPYLQLCILLFAVSPTGYLVILLKQTLLNVIYQTGEIKLFLIPLCLLIWSYLTTSVLKNGITMVA